MNIDFSNIIFLEPLYFWGFLLIPIFLYWYYRSQKKGFQFQYLEELQSVFGKYSWNLYLKMFCLGAIFVLYIFFFAHLNEVKTSETIKKKGIDIVLALDISKSMEATDIKPNRLESAKKIVRDFLKKQQTNRIGLVAFSGTTFTSIPLTFDYNLIDTKVAELAPSLVPHKLSGSAIGDAFFQAEKLFDTEKRQRVVILITDGSTNLGVDPIKSVSTLQQKGIKVYTVGIGSMKGGYITYEVGPFKKAQKIPPLSDENLKKIAKLGGGKYFLGRDVATLKNILEIGGDGEKNYIEQDTQKKYKDRYQLFAFVLSILLGMFIILEFRVLRSD